MYMIVCTLLYNNGQASSVQWVRVLSFRVQGSPLSSALGVFRLFHMGLLIAYLLGILTAVKREDDGSSRSKQTTLPGQSHPLPDGPLSVVCVPPTLSNEEAAEQKKQKRHRTITFWVQIATLVVFCVYAGFTIAIWSANRESASAARDGVIVARDSLVAGQRAYVIASGMKHKLKTITNPRGKRNKAFEFTSQWENAGNTPAIGVLMLFGVWERYDLTEAEFMGKAISPLLPTAMSSVGPKTTIDSGVAHQPEDFATSEPEVPRLFWGWIVYRDIFPNSKIHVTEFCLKTTQIVPDGHGDYGFDATVCDHHNCVDEFCEDYAEMVTLSRSN